MELPSPVIARCSSAARAFQVRVLRHRWTSPPRGVSRVDRDRGRRPIELRQRLHERLSEFRRLRRCARCDEGGARRTVSDFHPAGVRGPAEGSVIEGNRRGQHRCKLSRRLQVRLETLLLPAPNPPGGAVRRRSCSARDRPPRSSRSSVPRTTPPASGLSARSRSPRSPPPHRESNTRFFARGSALRLLPIGRKDS